MSLPVAKVAPVELTLLAGLALETQVGPFCLFLPLAGYGPPELGIATRVASFLNLHKELMGVVHPLFPTLAQIAAVGIQLPRPGWARPIALRRLMQVLPHRPPVHAQLAGNLALAHPFLIHPQEFHPSLHSQHRFLPGTGAM
jgi:hypothetical protein